MPIEDLGPISELMFGEHNAEEMYDEIRQRGSQLSVLEACQYFCTSCGVEPVLERTLDGTGRGIGHYRVRADQTLDFLEGQGRVVRPRRYREAVDAIENCGPDQAVIIYPNLLRGAVLKKRQPIRLENEVERGRIRSGLSLDTAADAMCRQPRIADELSGYSWHGYNAKGESDNIRRIIGLWDIVRGSIYDEALSHLALRAAKYDGARPFQTGVLGAMVVPSFHDEGLRYRVGLDCMPLWRSDRRQAYQRGFNVKMVSDSPREFWERVKMDRSQGRNLLDEHSDQDGDFQEQRWDHHATFAYLRMAREAERQGEHLLMPFRRPDARTIKMYWKMIHNTLRRERDDEGKWHLHPLRGDDVELLMWKYVARRREERR